MNRVLDEGWRFLRADAPGAQNPEFDDSAWLSVRLPHTWNALDGQDGGNDYYRGPAWYRRALRIDESLRGRSLFLRFEGAASAAAVYVNGALVGTHRGIYGAFCFDITRAIRDGANQLAVRVDNTKFDDIPPLSGDFTVFGGIYRPVHLLALDPLGITPLDDASPGVYAKTSVMKGDSAVVQVTTKLRNDRNEDRVAGVECRLLDRDGKTVASATQEQRIPSRGAAEAVLKLNVANPHLWQAREDPYLYRLIVDVKDGQRLADRIGQNVGLRYYRIDPDRGFLLNDKPYPLRGVNRHQDRFNMGSAITSAEHRQDFELIREIGASAVRLAHYQQADEVYTICDEAGLVVWAELALVNEITYIEAFSQNTRQQLRELIKQNYNHPSICFWSLFNEIGFKSKETPVPAKWKIIEELNALAHELDDTRLTTGATHLPVTYPANWVPDVTAFNRYWGWYTGRAEDWPKGLDEMRASAGGRAIGISEYGAGASLKQHEPRPTSRPRAGGNWHPEEWQAIVHENAWRAIKDRPWLWCTFVWNMFDFAADQRKEGDQFGRNDKGLVSYDRQVKKDAFWFYKANWSTEPVLHINAQRYEPRPAGLTAIKIYSNCDSVELFVNGDSLGKKQPTDGVVEWSDATIREGRNDVRAQGMRAGQRHEASCAWTGVTP